MRPPSSLRDRFDAKWELDPETGCWLWTASCNSKGYPQIRAEGTMKEAHSVGYRMMVGPVPKGLELDHLCRRITCVNPHHLQPVTHAENIRRGDLSNNGAAQRARTHCPKGHPYSGENLYIGTGGRRHCRACRREWERNRKRQRSAA